MGVFGSKKNEREDALATEEEAKSNPSWRPKSVPVVQQTPVVVGSVEWVEGMIALRKGRRCRIERIDRINDPPSCSVFMFDTESMVETEFSRLTVADPEDKGDADANSLTEEAKSVKAKENSSQENVPEIIEENKKTNTTTAEAVSIVKTSPKANATLSNSINDEQL